MGTSIKIDHVAVMVNDLEKSPLPRRPLSVKQVVDAGMSDRKCAPPMLWRMRGRFRAKGE